MAAAVTADSVEGGSADPEDGDGSDTTKVVASRADWAKTERAPGARAFRRRLDVKSVAAIILFGITIQSCYPIR